MKPGAQAANEGLLWQAARSGTGALCKWDPAPISSFLCCRGNRQDHAESPWLFWDTAPSQIVRAFCLEQGGKWTFILTWPDDTL